MQSIKIQLSYATYHVLVGPGLFENLDTHLQQADLKPPYLVVSQPRIFKAVGGSIRKKYPVILMPDGERAKSLTTVQQLLNRMAALKLNRQSTVVALGGGVVGDVSGFVASIYMRGIAVVQVPTTLLAQVDSSIGGKTGVNHRLAKNLIGTFHQPRLVISDPGLLRKLPDREYASGLYEALKYGIMRDDGLFKNFRDRISLLLKRDPVSLEELIGRCAQIKADVVMADEKESNLRRILNLGHTIGHALEAATKYTRIKHGEAVGYGMIAAARISARLHKLSEGDRLSIEEAIASIGKLPRLGRIHTKDILNALAHDKKMLNGAVHFVLPVRVGRVEITPDVPLEVVQDVVKGILDEGSRK